MSTIINIEYVPWQIIVANLWRHTSYIGPKGIQTDKAYGFYIKRSIDKIILYNLVGRQKMSCRINTLSGEVLNIILNADNNTIDVTEYDEYHGKGTGLNAIENAKKWYINKITNCRTYYRIVTKIREGFYTYSTWYENQPDIYDEDQFVEIGFPTEIEMIV